VRRTGVAAVGLLGTVGALLAGCGGVGTACPLYRLNPVVTVDASPWVGAHPGAAPPGPAARMGVCLPASGAGACTAADAAARARPLPAGHGPALFTLPGLAPGTHEVRVVLLAADGRVLLDAAGPLVVRHVDGGRCHNGEGDTGGARVGRDGRVAPL
jgi:hypothetical protein